MGGVNHLGRSHHPHGLGIGDVSRQKTWDAERVGHIHEFSSYGVYDT